MNTSLSHNIDMDKRRRNPLTQITQSYSNDNIGTQVLKFYFKKF